LAIKNKTGIAVLLSLLGLAAVVYVQNYRVPGSVEIAVRAFMMTSGWLVPPILIVFAYRTWTKLIRPLLPIWRNGLALSSMVLLFCDWLFAVLLLALRFIAPTRIMFFNLDWIGTVLDTTLAAALLAVALRGAARNYLIAAALLMWAHWQSEIYF